MSNPPPIENVTPDELSQVVQDYHSAGASSVTTAKQDDGNFTVVATFGDAPIAGPAGVTASPAVGGGAASKPGDINDLVAIARNEIGTEEDANHQNEGSSIQKYQNSTSLGGQGWPWCAAFVDWCVQQYVQKDETIIAHVPRTAAAFGLITWGNDNHFNVFNPPSGQTDQQPGPGDIVVYEFSHCGIVSAKGDTNHDFFAIEGNTNPGGGRDGYEVAERGRNYSSVKKFIRIPV